MSQEARDGGVAMFSTQKPTNRKKLFPQMNADKHG